MNRHILMITGKEPTGKRNLHITHMQKKHKYFPCLPSGGLEDRETHAIALAVRILRLAYVLQDVVHYYGGMEVPLYITMAAWKCRCTLPWWHLSADVHYYGGMEVPMYITMAAWKCRCTLLWWHVSVIVHYYGDM